MNERSDTPKKHKKLMIFDPATWAGIARGVAISFVRQIGVFYRNPVMLFHPTAIHPLHSIKVHRRRMRLTQKPPSTWQIMKNIAREEGMFALLRHVLPPLLVNVFAGTLLFATYAKVSSELIVKTKMNDLTNSPLPSHTGIEIVFFAGAVAGTAHSLVSCPVEVIKLHLHEEHVHTSSEQPRQRQHIDYFSALRVVLHNHGLRGLYRGFGTSFIKDAMGFATFFGTYDACKAACTAYLPSFFAKETCAILLSGTAAGLACAVMSHPWDVLQAHMIKCNTFDSTYTWPNYRECIGYILHKYGVRAFFFNLAPRLRRSVSPSAVGFLVYELALKRYETTARFSYSSQR
jgi:hypothetical protein